MSVRLRTWLLAAAAWLALRAESSSANRYWDTAPVAGIQGGTAAWNSVDATWSDARTGTALSAWVPGSSAWFVTPATAAVSVVTVDTSLSVASVTVSGVVYSIIVTNGGAWLAGSAPSVIGANAAGATVIVAGGPGGTSRWEVGTSEATQNLSVGVGATASGNALLIDGAGAPGGAVVTGAAAIAVGGTAPLNTLTVRNGGALYSTGPATIGSAAGANSNRIAVSGVAAPALWDAGGAAIVAGIAGREHAITVDGGGTSGGATVTNAGAISVCAGGSLSALIITNGGRVSSTAGLTVGAGTRGQATITDGRLDLAGGVTLNGTMGTVRIDTNAVLTCGGGLMPGGVSNTLLVVNGGRYAMLSGGLPATATRNTGGYNTLVVSGDGSTLDGAGNTQRVIYWSTGGGQFGNLVIVANGGVLTNMGLTLHIQNTPTPVCRGNGVLVTNGGRWYSASDFTLNDNGAASPLVCSHTAMVAGAESLWDNGRHGISTGGGSNHLIIVDAGLVTNVTTLSVGGGNGNTLMITNGGRVFSYAASLGADVSSSNNAIRVSGAGSLWHLGGSNLTIGTAAGAPQTLTIDRGAEIASVGTLAANTNSRVLLLGGTLSLTACTMGREGLVTAGDGTQAATLRLLGGTCVFSNGLAVASNATLTGRGQVRGATTIYGTLAPGAPVGALTNAGPLTLDSGAMTRIDIATNAVPGSGWDYVAVSSGALTLGGRLMVSLAGGFMPSDTNRFVIMTNTVPLGGAFANASDGSRVPAFGSDARIAGTFRVGVEAQCVTLSAFKKGPPPQGEVIHVR